MLREISNVVVQTLQPNRIQIEEGLTALARRIDISRRDGVWLEDTRLGNYIDAWRALHRCYETTGDISLDPVLLRQSGDFASALHDVIENEAVRLRRRKRAQLVLAALTEQVDRVFAQIEQNVRRQHGY